jgi:lipopolysaccharide export system permease protein
VGRFDRYMLSQLMVIFGFSSVVLVLIYWINRAVRLFDWLIASGQSAAVFLEFTALTLPNVIRVVLPISAFVATLYTANRLTSESELVVVQANGFSPYRLARPVLVFGMIVAAFMAILINFIVPVSFARLAERQVEVAENVTAQLLVEGRFVHPAEGMTLYIRAITGSGELKDVYLHDSREPARQVTYTATDSRLVRTENGPRLIMYDGIAEVFETPKRTLSVTRFEDFAIDVSALLGGTDSTVTRRSTRDATTWELLAADPKVARELRTSPEYMIHQGHERLAQPLIAITAPLIGFATLLLGGFSRFGVWYQIFGAVGLVILLYIADKTMVDVAQRLMPSGWPLIYVPQIAGGLGALLILWLAANPQIWRRRKRRAASA